MLLSWLGRVCCGVYATALLVELAFLVRRMFQVTKKTEVPHARFAPSLANHPYYFPKRGYTTILSRPKMLFGGRRAIRRDYWRIPLRPLLGIVLGCFFSWGFWRESVEISRGLLPAGQSPGEVAAGGYGIFSVLAVGWLLWLFWADWHIIFSVTRIVIDEYQYEKMRTHNPGLAFDLADRRIEAEYTMVTSGKRVIAARIVVATMSAAMAAIASMVLPAS